MHDTVHVVAQFTVRAEVIDDFIAAANRLLVVPTQSEVGCIRYELCQDLAEAAHFVLLESWASAADLDRHLAQDSLGAVLDELRPFVAAPPVTHRLKPV
jgi:quinol monooxygenase YgiN